MGDDSGSRGRGFKSRLHILDGHDIFHIDLLYFLFEKTKNKQRSGWGWPIKKATKIKNQVRPCLKPDLDLAFGQSKTFGKGNSACSTYVPENIHVIV